MASSHTSGARIPGDSLFERARDRVSIEAYVKLAGEKLVGANGDLRGPCILCDSGTTKFRVFKKANLRRFRCYDCEAHGDVVDLVAAHTRREPLDAARWLLDEDVVRAAPPARQAVRTVEGPTNSDKVAAATWAEARPFTGTLAERYLLGRGIAAGVVMMAAAQLRYHPAAKHHWDAQARTWVRAPAMVAQVVVAGADGEPIPAGGIHCTYLDRATGGKARFLSPEGKAAPAKLMWGRQSLDGKTGGAWLIGPDVPVGNASNLVVAEGIETSLSLATLAWRRGLTRRACAALSLNRLQGVLVRDDDGCVDPMRPVGDPAVPAFTWPTPGYDPWDDVLVAVDMDMSPVKARVRTGRGKPVDARLTTEVRARICGHLAVAAWTAAGAPRVRAIAPPMGTDFNDELRRVLAREGVA